MDIVADNIQKLKAIFPDVFIEGKVDFEKLEAVLGNYIEKDNERYNFTWHGKSQALRLAQTPSTGTLRPCKEESKNWDTTQNLYIEGDNLEVLKLLQKNYHNKIKIIYLDPPYNTGNDFVYEDDYRDNVMNYLEITRQIDDEGRKISTNSESGGRYHTNWLNMLYPRLRLARNLLMEDGVIFISIDDNEIDNLKNICNEVFGEDNFIATFPWRKRTTKTDVPFGVSQDFEWIVCYTKQAFFAGQKVERKYYSSIDYPNDRWRLSDLTTQKTEDQRPNSAFDLIDPKTNKIYKYNPKRLWGITKDTFDDYYTRGKIVFPDDYDFLNITIPAYRVFESEDREKAKKKYGIEDAIKSVSTVLPKEVGMSEDGNKEMSGIFGKKIFSFPKPTKLIKYLMSFCVERDYIVLDLFSGSATTADAVMQLNQEDGGNRKYIMVQLPELTDSKSEAYKSGYFNLCQIGKERIRHSGNKIQSKSVDIGFKVLKLDSSNIRKWNPDYDNIEQTLYDHINNFVEGRTELDVVFEIMLKYGIDLTMPIDEYDLVGKRVYSIGFGALIICLEQNIDLDIAHEITKLRDELQPEVCRVVFRDNGFRNDTIKTNVKENLKVNHFDEIVSI